jgi:hypothetical protein
MYSRPSQHRRFGAAVLAAVLLAVPLLALLHGSHAHRFCPEHGTFEEAEAAGDARVLAVLDADTARIAGAAAEGPVEGHASCPLLSEWRRPGLSGAGPASPVGSVASAETQRASRLLPPPQVSLLAVAPKGSPPRA